MTVCKVTKIVRNYISKSNIFEIWRVILENVPSKHLLVSKTPWRRLEDDLSVTIYFFKTSWKMKIVTPKKFWRRLEDISWRRPQDVFEAKKIFTGKEYISVSNKPYSASDKSIFSKPISHKSLAKSRQIQEALIKTK